jgi:hypothetical protein
LVVGNPCSENITVYVGVLAGLIVRVKEIVWVVPPLMPVTVIVKDPVGVEEVVVIVRTDVKVGMPDEGLKEHEAPAGNPLVHERETCWAAPLRIMAVMMLEPEEPSVTIIPQALIPAQASRKSKDDDA